MNLPDDFVFRHFLEAIASNLEDRSNQVTNVDHSRDIQAASMEITRLLQARVRGKSLAEQGDDAQQSTRKEAASDAEPGGQSAVAHKQSAQEESQGQPLQGPEEGTSLGPPPSNNQLSKMAFKWYFAASKNQERGDEAYQLAADEADALASQLQSPYLKDVLTSWFTCGWHSGLTHSLSKAAEDPQ